MVGTGEVTCPQNGAPPTKTRSRHGCWPCKARKVKWLIGALNSGEEKPSCLNCQKQVAVCDYSIRLNWEGRNKKRKDGNKHCLSSLPFVSGQRTVPGQQEARCKQNGKPNQSLMLNSCNRDRTQIAGGQVLLDPSARSLDGYEERVPNCQTSNPHPSTARYDYNYSDTRAARTSNSQSSQASPTTTTYGALDTEHHICFTGYPSPVDSTLSTPEIGSRVPSIRCSSGKMPPPLSLPTACRSFPQDEWRQQSLKRPRLTSQARPTYRSDNQGASSLVLAQEQEVLRMQSQSEISLQCVPNKPSSPTDSSINSDDSRQIGNVKHSSFLTDQKHSRRLSVSSLLSDTTRGKCQESALQAAPLHQNTSSIAHTDLERSRFVPCRHPSKNFVTYGLDRGLADLDLSRTHDDTTANSSPTSRHYTFHSATETLDREGLAVGFGPHRRDFAFAKGGYYACPVPIRIPKSLEPLPSALLDEPMNLLYFHHFLNHTAKILVVHDCVRNPFRTILPQMAIQNAELLNLLLAYSATHRARLLAHPEPAIRIAHWVQDVFPSLGRALDVAENFQADVSDATLATAIMLTSLEIISPSAFGISVSWQNHLQAARKLIRHRRQSPRPIRPQPDPALYFLQLWLAYIDVFGSLSSRTLDDAKVDGAMSLADLHQSANAGSLGRDNYTIECMLGFTPHCVFLLAQIADLARVCSVKRNDLRTGKVNSVWRPPPDIETECRRLEWEVEQSRLHPVEQCSHYSDACPFPALDEYDDGKNNGDDYTKTTVQGDESIANVSLMESTATNSAFHLAALIHLLRRVRNLPRDHPRIRSAVNGIVSALSFVRPGSSADACLLFPMFTAGAEAVAESDDEKNQDNSAGEDGVRENDAWNKKSGCALNKVLDSSSHCDGCGRPTQTYNYRRLHPHPHSPYPTRSYQTPRQIVLTRIKGLEDIGMMQIGRARRLLEVVWTTGRDWEGLTRGEFFG